MYPYVIVDVFTDTPLEGNPLAVFIDGRDIASPRMQRIAREMNLSETVFVLPPTDGADARIRIFTPSGELAFAGHPTLGSAFVLGEQTGREVIRLETGAGVIPVELVRQRGRIVSGRMQQPIPSWEPYRRVEELLAALGVESAQMPVEAYRNGHCTSTSRIAFGQEIEISQGAEIGRPSKLHARVDGDGERIDKVEVAGSAVVVAHREFHV